MLTRLVAAPVRPRLAAVVRGAALLLLVLAATPRSALAVSTRDLVALAQAGLSDEVLVALVESDDTAYNLDAPQILELRRGGLSERVILAMIRNAQRAADARAAAAQPPVEQPYEDPPSLVIIGDTHPQPQVAPAQTEVIVVPFVPFIAQPVVAGPHRHGAPRTPGYRGFGRFINDGWVDRSAPRAR
jgi:hypothetical protein